MYRISFRQIVLVAVVSAVFATAGTLLIVRLFAEGGASGGAVLPSFGKIEPVALADPTVATDEQNNIDIYRALAPGVVNITTTAEIDTFFGAYPQQGSGSGSIIEVNGQRVILTNFHVVREALDSRGRRASIEVALNDKSTYPATVVGADPDHDLAVLRINAPAEKLRVVPLGTSSNLQVGQKVLAIGNPFGLDQTLTTGIISALERPLQSPSGQQISGVIQTDAAINPGNSGGPLLNSRGEMIGINTAILSESGANVGIGFAVPIDIAKRIIPDLIERGRVARAFLGIGYRPMDPRVAKLLDVDPKTEGLLITNVEPGSPAARAGIHGVTQTETGYAVGDILISADGRPTKGAEDLSLVLNAKRPGESVALEVLRAGRPARLQVTLVEAPPQQAMRAR